VGLVVADFNNDGRPDIALGNDSGRNVSVLLGNDTQPLTVDPASGLRLGAGRGNLSNNSQADYWSFDAVAGDLLSVACEIPGNPSGSGLHFILYRPDGSQWTDFYGDYYGRGQGGGTIPVSGTYTLRVEPNYNYYGEYRFRMTIAQPPTQLEWENNDSLGNANGLNYTLNAGHRQATVLGYISSADSGDWFRLGTLSSNAVISLSLLQPSRSGFGDLLDVFNPAGSLVSSSAIGASNLTYTVPPGAEGAYYARVRAASGVLPPVSLHPTGSSNTLFYSGNAYAEAMIDIPESALAVSFWFRTLDPSAPLFSVGGGGHDRHIYLNGGNIYTRIYSGPTVNSSGLSLADGAWHYVVFTYGSAIGGNKTYVDGVEAASGSKAFSDFTGQDRIRFGYSEDAPSRYLSGSLDEVRLWNYAFTPADVLWNQTNSLTPNSQLSTTNYPGLLGYWRCNEGAGTTALDATTNAHPAMLIGNPSWIPAANYGFTSPGLFAQYLLNLDLRDATPTAITSVSLPAAGTTNAGLLDRFTLSFSKEVEAGPLNALNRDVRLYNGHAYTISDSSTWWYYAEQQARALGGHLVTINDALENAWVYTNFSGYGNLWTGLNDEARKGTYLWSSGEAVTYTNWDSGQPYNGNNQDYVLMRGGGRWADYTLNSNNRGVIEVAGPDTDGDGIPDTLDPYPTDPYNGFDLRAAGPDGLFDTPDDQVYHFTHANYTGGLSLDFALTDGPLQPGSYRFRVSSALRDLFANPMSGPFVQYFSVADVPGYALENRNNNSAVTATPLPLVEDPPGVKSAAARGNLSSNSDYDYWSFSASGGDLVTLATYIPGSPGGSQLYYRVFKPDGSQLFDYYPSYYGDGQSGAYTLPVSGTYTVLVSYNYNYQGEYRFRITTVSPVGTSSTSSLTMESEPNDTIGNATALSFAASTTTNGQSAGILGRIRTTGDLDYINLGTISNGYSIFLNVRLPGSSALSPIVSVYNAANAYQPESAGGRANDGVANVPITVTGTYYALVRSGNGSGGLNEQYVLDVNVVPTGSVNFPNLIVAAVNPPSGSAILSGQDIAYSFNVANIGNATTAVPNWMDRAVLSSDSILGNSDDIPLGFFPHSGMLNVGDAYGVNNTFTLPDGLSGDYYLIVQTDAGSAVNEYLFKGDNITVSSNAFHVDVAPYPDLVVENLKVAGPDGNNAFSITWNTANRGNAVAPAGFYERLLVRNQTA
ncbi:MAG TPA: LamG-like jellyroll fold domain-containing protein, partial [Bacillota bacterium]|nr:LamG-like jellyroll fold domain-containing protein [Bacillota bacterium]